MAKHWSKYLHERIAYNKRTIKSLSSVAHEAEKNLVSPSCECGGTWLKGGTVPHSVYHYIPAKIEKHIYYKNICVCSHCGVKATGKTPRVMPNSLFSNSMIAHFSKALLPRSDSGKLGEDFLELILVTDRYCGYSPLALLHQYCYVHLMCDVKAWKLNSPTI